MLATLSFAVSITAPIFALVALGWLLRRLDVINAAFVNTASRMAFLVGLPATLFMGLYRLDLNRDTQWGALVVTALATLLVCILGWRVGRRATTSSADLGVMVQGTYRGNLAIVGLALCERTYGAEGVALAALPVGLLTAWYNIIAVYLLGHTHGGATAPGPALASMARNPLIIGVAAGLLVSATGIELPAVALATLDSLARMAIPLALICIGGTISLAVLGDNAGLALRASAMRLLMAPAVITGCLWLAGYSGPILGVMFLLSAPPTAAASFVMVQAVRGNVELATSIIVWTTCGSVFTLTAWLVVLRGIGLL